MTHNGHYPIWHPGLADFIPSIPDGRTSSNSMGRELPRVCSQDAGPTRIAFDPRTGLLQIKFSGHVVKNEFDDAIARCEQRYGSDAVKEVRLWISPQIFAEKYVEYDLRGFERRTGLERADSGLLCVERPGNKRW